MGRRQIPFGFGGISRSSASLRQVSLTISSCAQSHYISRLQSDATWQKQQLIMLRTATEIDKGVVKSTKRATGCDKARRRRWKTEVTYCKMAATKPSGVFCGQRQFRSSLWPIMQADRRRFNGIKTWGAHKW